MGETHYQDPANPCKRRCTKGLGQNYDGREEPIPQSNQDQLAQPPSSTQSTDSSVPENGSLTPLTPDMHQVTAPNAMYPVHEPKPQQLGQFSGSYDAWENSTTLKEFERKLEEAASNGEKMEDVQNGGREEGRFQNGSAGVNGEGLDGNGLHANGGQNGEGSHLASRNPKPQFGQSSMPNQFSAGPSTFKPEVITQSANKWNEDFYNHRQNIQNGFSGAGSPMGFGSVPANGNGLFHGPSKANPHGQIPYWNGSHPGTPSPNLGGHRLIMPHPNSAPSTPPINGYGPYNPPMKTEHQQYAPRSLSQWLPQQHPQSQNPYQQMHGHGTPPPGFYPNQNIKSEALVKSEYGRSPTPNGNGFGSTKRGVIDLTADDDDDCIVTKQTIQPRARLPVMKTPCPIPPDHVCFGMIKGATVKAHKVPTPRHATGPACWPQIPICLERVPGGCTLAIRARDCSRYEVGCLDLNTARGLADLMDRKMVRLQTRFCSRNKGQGEVPGMDFPNGPQQLSVYINVYGQERMAGMVGGHLRAKGITLHSPLYPDPVPYLNPHDPKNRALVNQHLNRFVEPTPTSVQTVTKTQDELKTDVITVLNHLERWKDLDEMEQDDKIVTPLLGHQKLGLAFMTARENDVEHNGTTGSLWEYTKPHYGKARWRNIITMDEIDTPPPQCYGGILADVMGLGKTLSILSLIASTTDKAVEYAKEPAHKGANGNQVTPVKTTLLIAPLSTISNWEEQVKQHIKPGTMSMYVYHGGNRQKDLEQLKNYDIVMTTYQIIAGEMGRFLKKNSTFKTLFGEFSFFRIVLDEAHMIREQNTSQFKGVVAIEAQRRWAVTGTPIQNRLDDLHALIAFIRLKPFDNKRVFKENIAVPFKLQSENCLERVRTLVDSITIRRQKDKINLPERKDKVVTLEMDSDQREIYEATRKQSDNRFRNVAKAGNLSGKAYVHILQAILRLRMISAHGRELLGEDEIAGMTSTDAIDIDEIEEKRGFVTPKDAYTVFSLMKDTGQDNCEICSTKIESQADKPKGDVIGYLTPCYHLICKNGCVETYNRQMAEKVPIEGREGPCCLCPNQVNTAEVFQLQEGGGEEVEAGEKAKSGKKSVRYRGPSVKVRKLISSLMENRTSGTPEEPVKSVVFSCWTSHMDLIGRALDDHGIQFVRLDGTMSRPSRSEVIEKFRNDPAIEVIIISIAAGGLGLNLTCAQRVYVMEPQFNPAAEAQAVDRVHRLGQKHIVYVTWYIMKDSFEDKILELQKKKQDIANLSLTGKCHDGKDLKRQRLADLVSLFK